ncbi:MAG: RNA polymerase sigma factor, partial [Planctomycetota bacterium]
QNQAWTQFVDRYLRLVCFVIRRTFLRLGRSPSEADVEDIAFEFFESLVRDNYRALASLREPYDRKAWLAVSARRRAIDFVRRRKETVSLDEPSSPAAAPPADSLQEESDPTFYREALRQSLEVLNERERAVVEGFYFDGRSYREIADGVGINPNSIGPTLLRAVEKIRSYLAERNLLNR